MFIQRNILYSPVYWLSSWNRNSNFQKIGTSDWSKQQTRH